MKKNLTILLFKTEHFSLFMNFFIKFSLILAWETSMSHCVFERAFNKTNEQNNNNVPKTTILLDRAASWDMIWIKVLFF